MNKDIFDPTSIKKMSDVIHHRGPDDEGYVFFEPTTSKITSYSGKDTPESVKCANLPYTSAKSIENAGTGKNTIVFGHRRLSIIDLTPAGHQPMCYQNRRYWIVFNGEIYNWKELRSELELLGHKFQSHTDTEVILAAYTQWGKECLHRLNGMWAFVLYDTKDQSLFASRDRFGIKPLYYWYSPEGFLAFASEIKQFTVLPGWIPKLNKSRAYDYLVRALTDHTSETLFEGVFQLRGGAAVEFCIGDTPQPLPVYQWYSLKYTPFNGSLDTASEAFRKLFTDSVNLQLRADVPVGSCLSGGLDSSSIVCVVNTILKAENKEGIQKTFSACSHVKRFDEREYIEEVGKIRQIETGYVYPSLNNLFGNLDEIIWHHDEPFGSTSVFAQWLVFKLAADSRVTVMLDGQGADEQLCGYHTFFIYRFIELFRQGRWMELTREMKVVNKQFGYSSFIYLKAIMFYEIPQSFRSLLAKVVRKRTIQPSWISLSESGFNPDLNIADFRKMPIITAFSQLQLFFTSLPMLLHWEDRDSMAHSIESRVPFLDHRLVESVLNLPSEYKIKGDCTKIVLRHSMSGILPEKIRSRKDKMGFVTAEEDWVLTENSDLFRQEVEKAIVSSRGVLNEHALSEFEEIVAGNRPFSFVIWRWICFGRWMEKYSVIN
jgi:asparagine synthase (glutamine-hydrolysing)